MSTISLVSYLLYPRKGWRAYVMQNDPLKEFPFVIQFIPDTKFNRPAFFDVRSNLFGPLESATRFRNAEAAIAYANEFGIKLDKYTTTIVPIKEVA